MLDVARGSLSFEQMLSATECRVNLPADWNEAPGASAAPQAWLDEDRRFVRFPYRTRAIIEYASTLPAIPRPAMRRLVYTKDLSRQGVALLNAEQLFPLERFRLWLPGSEARQIEVLRIHKVQESCYEIGARFV